MNAQIAISITTGGITIVASGGAAIVVAAATGIAIAGTAGYVAYQEYYESQQSS